MSSKMQKNPSIRFKGFTDAWEQRKLGERVTIKSGWSPSNFVRTNSEGSELFIKVDDLNYSSREQNDSQMRVNDNPRFQKMKKGSTIFPKRGAAIMTNKVRILSSDAYMDTNMMALEPQEIDGDFLYTFIDRTGLYKIADTSTIPQINNKHIEPYIIYCPSIEEQTKVGSIFKKLDDTIALHQRQLNKFNKMKKTMLQKMFPQNGEKFPEIRFDGFTKEWNERKLIDVADIYDNLRVPVTASDRVKGNIPYYGANGIQDYVEGFTHDGEFILIAEDGANDLVNYPVNYVNGKVWVNNHAHVVSGKKESLYNLFLASRIRSMNISTWLVGGGRAKLNGEVLKKIPLMIPSLEEQTKIGDFFKQLDGTIVLHQQKIRNYQEIKKVMLQQMFV